MKTTSYTTLFSDIRTLDDLHLLKSEIDTLLSALFQTDNTAFKAVMDTKLQRNLGNALTKVLTDANVSLTDQETLQKYFSGLKEFIATLPIVQLTLAYHPTNEQIEQLSDWLRRETGQMVILELRFDKRLLGGAVIVYNGKYQDLSLKTKLDRVYEEKKAELIQLLQ